MASQLCLLEEVDPLFDKPLSSMKPATRERVEEALFPFSWDELDPTQRRVLVLQFDSENGPRPSTEPETGGESEGNLDDLRWQLEVWSGLPVSSADQSKCKEDRLRRLQAALRGLEPKSRRRKGVDPGTRFIPYPRVEAMLAVSINATPEEIAAWVWLGPRLGGIKAYRNANELSPPPRFFYDVDLHGDGDYLKPLMGCWFLKSEIDRFRSAERERFLTGTALIERWSSRVSRPRAFIEAKIEESRLLSIHPVFGGTREQFQDSDKFPPLESGLFSVTDVEQIEAHDFPSKLVDVPPQSVEASRPPSPQSSRNAAIRAKHKELMQLGKRNFVKEIQRTVPGADSLGEKRIRDIVKGR